MNFFEHQARARRNTWLLGFYFALAVASIVLAVNAAVCFAAFQRVDVARAAFQGPGPARTVLQWTTGITLGLIALGTLFKIAELSTGRSVAASMGGALIPPDTQDPAERRLVNVVEEMSLASGIPAPFLYVLPENGINAFASGTSPNTAAVAVSRGALESLTRDELQGVVAHEFSHVFNGDMRMNLRLIGLLHGILLLAVIGRGVMNGSGRRSSRDKNAGGAIFVGFALVIIGYIGVFFAQLIKSAISRQREFLADASAVQFTRNPAGILGALLKIRNGAGSLLSSAKTEEVSHFLFAAGLRSFFATHPPLDARIRAIDPAAELSSMGSRPPSAADAPGGAAGFAAPARSGVPSPGPAPVAAPEAVVAAVGNPSPESLAAAREVLAAIPDGLRTSLASAAGARAAAYAVLLAEGRDERRRQLAHLGEEGHAAGEAYAVLTPLGARARLPLLELAVPALRAQPPADKAAFFARLRALVEEDGRTSPAEALAEAFLRSALREGSPSGRPGRQDVVLALSVLAHAGHASEEEAARAFQRGVSTVPGLRAFVIPALEMDAAALPPALGRLAASDPEFRRRVMEAAAACASADGTVTVEEWEVLRVFAAAVECPIPAGVPIS